MSDIVGGMVTSLPSGFIVHQDLNFAVARRFLDGARIFDADRQWLLHHYVDAVPRTNLDNAAVIVPVAIGEDRVGMSALQHVFQIRIKDATFQSETVRILGGKFLAGSAIATIWRSR